MQIATFNINRVDARLEDLPAWLDSTELKVACLQEITCADAAFPDEALRRLGYGGLTRAGTRHGLAILARGVKPLLTQRSSTRRDGTPPQPRYEEASVAGILIGFLYRSRVGHKEPWLRSRLQTFAPRPLRSTAWSTRRVAETNWYLRYRYNCGHRRTEDRAEALARPRQ